MNYAIETAPLDSLKYDCLILGVYQDLQLSATTHSINISTKGLINTIVSRGDINGKNGETVLINAIPDNPIERILLVGLGENKPLTSKNYRKALLAAINSLKKTNIKSILCCLADAEVIDANQQWKTRQIIEVFNDAIYQFTAYKSNKEITSKIEKIGIFSPEAELISTQLGLNQGRAIADGMNLTKLLGDLPGNICTPSYLAEQAFELGKKYPSIDISILEENDMEKLNMGAFLSVSRGSRQPAKLITLNYQGGKKDDKPIVLIGKGLTFDAGGISLKQAPGMDEMKYDMCGAASVLGTFKTIGLLNLPMNVIGIIPTCENLPDGLALKPGDILTSMSGQTIEVLNTDAEGRLILCDALTFAERFNPEVVIDIATLTGACVIALGHHASGLYSNDDKLAKDLESAGQISMDRAWRMPLWEDYQSQLDSNFADMANIGGRAGGSITAACFLSRFAKKYKWAHLDIAGTAWKSGKAKGATGRPVGLLTQYILNKTY